MEFKNKTVLVAGTGISGIGAVSLLQKLDANIVIYDGNAKLNKKDLIDKMKLEENTPIYLGEFPLEILNYIEILVLSPGISVESEFIIKAKKAGVRVIGEIELAFNLCKGKIIAITGTNGKTTTTALVGAIMKHHQEDVFVVGNIGNSFAQTVLKTTDNSVTVAEISSFQLETTDRFKPEVSTVLNISPDHLDRHHTLENYLDIKMNIASNQDEENVCILNYEDDLLKEYASKLHTNIRFFSSKNKINNGVYLEADKIIINNDGINTVICSTKELKLLGIHNYENIMAAILITLSIGVPLKEIREAVINFKSVEHRIEFVATKNGVDYYNDSKGTNTDASIKAIEAMPGKTVLIAGGYDKGGNYDDWIKTFKDKIKCIILIGETKYKIADSARRLKFNNILFAQTLEEAVELASKEAVSGEAVLLSPACASWGMFKNFEQRGQLFKDQVNKI